MKNWLICMSVAVTVLMAGTVFGQKPRDVEVTQPGIDLFGHSFTAKVKSKKGVPTINNFTFYIANQGDTDAPNSRVEYWLSDDDVLTTQTDPMDPGTTVDLLIHTQSLGKVKSGKVKKRTVGGGLLKQLGISPLSDKRFILVIDADNVLPEALEDNNTLTGHIIN